MNILKVNVDETITDPFYKMQAVYNQGMPFNKDFYFFACFWLLFVIFTKHLIIRFRTQSNNVY